MDLSITRLQHMEEQPQDIEDSEVTTVEEAKDVKRPLHECHKGRLNCLENGFGVYVVYKESFHQVVNFCPFCGKESPARVLQRSLFPKTRLIGPV